MTNSNTTLTTIQITVLETILFGSARAFTRTTKSPS